MTVADWSKPGNGGLWLVERKKWRALIGWTAGRTDRDTDGRTDTSGFFSNQFIRSEFFSKRKILCYDPPQFVHGASNGKRKFGKTSFLAQDMAFTKTKICNTRHRPKRGPRRWRYATLRSRWANYSVLLSIYLYYSVLICINLYYSVLLRINLY